MSRGRTRSGDWKPVVGLLFLAPVVGELVGSGNVPTLLFLNPVVAFFFCMLYGPPALLMRELWVRRRVGWPGMLLLGFAFGALNEGIVAASWFKPDALDRTAHELGRVGHVNWNLVSMLTVFHTFVSMFVSIALAQLWFRSRAHEPWLRRRGLLLWPLVPLLIALGELSTGGKRHPRVVVFRPERAYTLLVIAVAVLVALALPRWRGLRSTRRVPTPRRAFWAGFGWFAAYLFTFFGMTKLAAGSVPVLAVVLWATAVALLLSWTGSGRWTARHTLLLCAGVVAPSMLLTSWRIVVLQPVSSALFVWWLVHLDRRLRAAAPG
jgi:hypothetical protein